MLRTNKIASIITALSILFLSVFFTSTHSHAVTGSISGTVTDGSGTPLTSAWVTLYDSSRSYVTSTNIIDSYGNYTFSGLASGTYFVGFESSGMIPVWYNGASKLQTATPIVVTAPDTVTGIDVSMELGGSISGTVTDASGAPMFAWATRYTSAGNFITPIYGHYTFSGLASGTYFVGFESSGLVPVWYNGASKLQTATPIVVSAPYAVIGIDVSMGIGGSISGTVTDGSGAPLTSVQATLYDSTGSYITSTNIIDSYGNYTFHGLASGTYFVGFESSGMIPVWFGGASTWQTATPIVVTAPDTVTGIDVSMEVGGSISGTISDASGAPLTSAWVTLYDSNRSHITSNFNIDVAGNYTFIGLASGTYYLGFFNNDMIPVWSGGASKLQTATPIVVTAPDTVTGVNGILKLGGRISGTVTDASGAPLTSAWPTLYDSTGNYVMDASYSSSGDTLGGYTISGLASGTYYLKFDGSGIVPVWYNGASTMQTATPIVVTAPDTVTGVDWKLVGDGNISGTVTDASGAPLEYAGVGLFDSSKKFITLALTDALGNYTIRGLASGIYYMNFLKIGMQDIWYNGTVSFQSPTPIIVTSPNSVTGINGVLGVYTGGSISGKVTDAAGVPLLNTPSHWVMLYDSAGNYITDALSDAQGNYIIRGLASGTYFAMLNFYDGKVPVWYGGASTLQTATPIVVNAPNAVTDINIRQVAGGSISGKVTDANGTPLSSVWVELYGNPGVLLFANSTTAPIAGTSTDPMGNYTFSAVPNGTYYVRFEATGMVPVWYNGGSSQQSATPVTIINTFFDLKNVTEVNGKIVTPLTVTISCSVSGAGTGTVTSSPAGISCVSGKSGGCSASFDNAQAAILNVTPSATSSFSGWSGDCTGIDRCVLNTFVNHNVTATFIVTPKAKIGNTGFTSLGLAYASVATSAEIHTLDTELVEDLTVQDKDITLMGGYKPDYLGLSGSPTVLHGVVRVLSGKLTASNIAIR